MQTHQVRKSAGNVIPIRRFETTHDEEEVFRANPSTVSRRRREDFLSEQIVTTLKNLLKSLRSIKA